MSWYINISTLQRATCLCLLIHSLWIGLSGSFTMKSLALTLIFSSIPQTSIWEVPLNDVCHADTRTLSSGSSPMVSRIELPTDGSATLGACPIHRGAELSLLPSTCWAWSCGHQQSITGTPTVLEDSLYQLTPSDSVCSFPPSPLDSHLIHLYFFLHFLKGSNSHPSMQINCWNQMGGEASPRSLPWISQHSWNPALWTI